MKSTLPRPALHGRFSPARVLLLAVALLLVPGTALTVLRPLVPPMLDNLGAVNRIGRAVALEDFEQVEESARGLIERAEEMSDIDLATVDIDPALAPQWKAFLAGQRAAAEGIVEAAKTEDATAVMSATQTLVGNACLGCHAAFRDPARLLRTEVHVMTGFLAAWHDVNRGLAMNDYNLIAGRARDLSAATSVISTDEMLEDAFGIGGSKSRRVFRGFLLEVANNAKRIEEAAKAEDLPTVLEASGDMWENGCLACHAKFRR